MACLRFILDLKTLKAIITAKLKGETQADDKTMIMEKTIQLVAALPSGSKRQEALTNLFIDELWYSLDHPPLLYMGDQFRFRQADGSNNVSSHTLQIRTFIIGNSLKSLRTL